MKRFVKDGLEVRIYASRASMGRAAAADIAARIRELQRTRDVVNVVFAAAPSQNEVHRALRNDRTVDWSRVRAFHMDEYIGLGRTAPQSFGNFLRRNLFSHIPLRRAYYIRGGAASPEAEAERYAGLLRRFPPDIVVMGIGENGHIAFNDPWVANFRDPLAAKVVRLDGVCRQQQVNDGCFAALDAVPEKAITLTVPTLAGIENIFCIVPAAAKAAAVRDAVEGPVGEACPASVLRTRGGAVLYLDPDSSSLLEGAR
jgi:glucosamine-6-phosphate deaminase